MQLSDIVSWINEREAIRLRKNVLERLRDKKPDEKIAISIAEQQAWNTEKAAWGLDYLTHDPVFRAYRCCNVNRENDRVTIWIRENIIKPFADHEHLWLMLAAARSINWPPTLQTLIESPQGWFAHSYFTLSRMAAVLERYKNEGNKVETGAYMIRAESDPTCPWYSWSKQRYIAGIVVGRLWDDRKRWQRDVWDNPVVNTGEAVHTYLKTYHGWGPFMAGQVVTDLKHTRYLRDCEDFNTWTALGPGSMRGLNRLHGRLVAKAIPHDKGVDEMVELHAELTRPGVLAPWVTLTELSDTQNVLCEVDKYFRVKLNQGKPRAKYVVGRGY